MLGPKTYVLVHGACHGAWCWRDVALRLRALGHAVHTPTLTGLGERSHLMAARPTLGMFIEDVAQVIRFEELERVVLVGHSFAGSVVSGLADRMPDRLRHLVYLDAQVLLSGECPADAANPEHIARYRARAIDTEHGPLLPPNPPEAFGVTDPAMAEWLETKLTPHPFGTYFDVLELRHPVGNGLPVTYVACTAAPLPNLALSYERARRQQGWTWREFATGHDAMLTMPAEVAEMLAAIA